MSLFKVKCESVLGHLMHLSRYHPPLPLFHKLSSASASLGEESCGSVGTGELAFDRLLRWPAPLEADNRFLVLGAGVNSP